MGVDGDDLGFGWLCIEGRLRDRLGPEVGLVEAEDLGDAEPVASVREAAGEPAADGLGVDADLFREVVNTKSPFVEGSS